MRHIIKDYKFLKDTRFIYLGASFVRNARIFLRDIELILKTVKFILATSLLDQFACHTKTLLLWNKGHVCMAP